MNRTIYFCVPGSLHQRTGGYIYDRRIIDELRIRGWMVEVCELAGKFPQSDFETCRQAELIFASFPHHALVIIDGLAAAGLESVLGKASTSLRLVILLHHPLAAETGLPPPMQRKLFADEKRVLALAQRVIVTSAFTARELHKYDVPQEKIAIVIPGVVVPNPSQRLPKLSSPSQLLNLLCVATFIPRKGHRILLDALALLANESWHLHLLGSTSRDPKTYSQVCQQIEDRNLKTRISIEGECEESVVVAAYHRANVFVLPSYYEGYGMVLSEACAYGLPIIACAGGAIPDTIASLGASSSSLLVEPGNPQALADALKLFMIDAPLRKRMIDKAQLLSSHLRTWSDAGAEFEQALLKLSNT